MNINEYLRGVKVLGLDVDGPVYRLGSALRNWLILRGWSADDLHPAPTSTYDFLATWPLTQEELIAELRAGSDAGVIYGVGGVHSDATYWLPRIYAAGTGVHLVTARCEPLAGQQTRDCFRAYGLPFDRLTLDHRKERVDGYDVLVDDHPGNVRRVLEVGRKAIILDRPWNRDVNDLPRATWEELGVALTSA